MSELIFVRHGQASFGSASYDKLSELGVEQVKILAQHWQQLGERFDCIYSGTLLRQRETANELLGLVEGSPSSAIQHPGLNEYNGDPIIRIYLRDHADADGFGSASGKPLQLPISDERSFQTIFESATAMWIRGELQPCAEDTEFEHWLMFQTRVYAAIDDIMQQQGKGRRVLISTSGGIIAMALQRVLQFPDQHVINTNWMVRNSSVTRVIYGNGKLSLTQFNGLAHLEKADLQHMITYR